MVHRLYTESENACDFHPLPWPSPGHNDPEFNSQYFVKSRILTAVETLPLNVITTKNK